MKILITGTSGRIGSALAFALKGRYQVIGVDIKPGPFTTHCLDIVDKKRIFDLAKDVGAIIHAAALHAPHVSICSDEKFWSVNVRGTENLLDACLKYKIKRFVFTSSTSIYGDALVSSSQAVWVTENLLPQPRDIYDETKLAAETLCENASSNSLSCISLRISRCFPEKDSLMAIYRLYRGVDIRDVVLGHELALRSSIEGYQVFNISSSTSFEGYQVFHISSSTSFQQHDLTNLFGKANEAILRYFPWAEKAFDKKGWKLPHLIDRVYVVEKAKKVLGYNPTYNFQELIGV